MLREKLKWRSHESQSTEAGHRGGVARSSEEGTVMVLERRGNIVRLQTIEQPAMGGFCRMKQSLTRLDDRSGMSREIHVPLREGAGVRFPRATRPLSRQVIGFPNTFHPSSTNRMKSSTEFTVGPYWPMAPPPKVQTRLNTNQSSMRIQYISPIDIAISAGCNVRLLLRPIGLGGGFHDARYPREPLNRLGCSAYRWRLAERG